MTWLQRITHCSMKSAFSLGCVCVCVLLSEVRCKEERANNNHKHTVILLIAGWRETAIQRLFIRSRLLLGIVSPVTPHATTGVIYSTGPSQRDFCC